MLVERKQWLTDLEFAELLSMGQLLPGPNISNLAVILGRQYFGIKGAFAAASGLYAFPFCIILMLGWAYQRYGQLPIVQHMLNGVMPVSAGLVIATALKLLRSFPRTWHTASFMLLAFVLVALLHWPLWLALLTLAPCAVLAKWRMK